MDKKKLLSKLQSDPLYHIERIQGCTTLEPYQKEVIKTVWANERTAVAASHDVGKTFLASKIILAFGSVFPGSKIITTAPTHNQVKRLLWSEIRAGFAKSRLPLGGQINLTEWRISEDWFAVGFTSRAEKSEGEGQGGASSFQGFHAPYILVVFDEATGIHGGIWKQLEGILTSGFVRFLAIGNPTTKSCEFFKCFSDVTYKKIKLPCFVSPNFPANGIHTMSDLANEYLRLKELNDEEKLKALESYKVVNQHLLTVRWVMNLALKWGLSHPLVVSKALAEFPEEDEQSLIPMGVIQEAQFRDYTPVPNDRVAIGVDVARYGTDVTVITIFIGRKQTLKRVLIHRDSNEIAGVVIQEINALKEKHKRFHIVIDGTGIGAGVVDALKSAKDDKALEKTVEIREVHFGAAPGPTDEDKKTWVNLKARIYCRLAEDLKNDLCLMDEQIYLEETPTIHYRFDGKGRWQIESKDEYKARTGRSSPDHSDSLALANYARYDAVGSGNFTEALLQKENRTIIKARRNQKLW